MPRIVFALAALAVALPGCGKVRSYTEPTVAVPEADPLDEAATLLLDSLARGRYDALASRTSEPLTSDMSRAEFDDLAAIVQWLGPLRSRTVDEDAVVEHGARSYVLRFDRGGDVDLEVFIDATGQLTGFEFSGKGFVEAERGVLAEPWREFRVYDFHRLAADGSRLGSDEPATTNRVEYELVVGGIEAVLGVHHLRVEKTLLDAGGSPVLREPIEFDTTFDQDAMGVPRGVVRGHVEVPGPGRWTLQLVISDENAHRAIEHEHIFRVGAAK
ncbi:MAG: hypothetical protein ACE37F_16475 [Nannocystaceae bacterium]|nr:hypothetical protein [bacterium]